MTQNQLKLVLMKKKIETNSIIIVKTKGMCMRPFFYHNDEVLIKKDDNYSIGDIVLIYTGSDYKVHRIIYKHKNKIITKGDHAYSCDYVQELIGKLYKVKSKPNRYYLKDYNYKKKYIAMLSYLQNLTNGKYLKNKKPLYNHVVKKIADKISKLTDIREKKDERIFF